MGQKKTVTKHVYYRLILLFPAESWVNITATSIWIVRKAQTIIYINAQYGYTAS